METKIKREKRYRRHKTIRAKVFGTSKVPRLCVFRSNQYMYAQLIDDEKGKTLVAASDRELKKSPRGKKIEGKEQEIRTGKVAIAYKVGKLIAKKALEKTTPTHHPIEKVVFDRGGYKYHGRVKALVEGAREGGLKF